MLDLWRYHCFSGRPCSKWRHQRIALPFLFAAFGASLRGAAILSSPNRALNRSEYAGVCQAANTAG